MLQKTIDRKVDDAGAERRLMCMAHECPNRWSVDAGAGGGGLCSPHQWADRRDWPRITDEQLRAVAQRYQTQPKTQVVRVMTMAEKRETLNALRNMVIGGSDQRAWAKRLQEKDQANPQTVTPTVRAMYRRALGLEA